MEWDPSGLEPAISSQELSNTLYGSFPFFAIPIAVGATRLLRSADALLGWTFLDLAAPGAQATLKP